MLRRSRTIPGRQQDTARGIANERLGDGNHAAVGSPPLEQHLDFNHLDDEVHAMRQRVQIRDARVWGRGVGSHIRSRKSFDNLKKRKLKKRQIDRDSKSYSRTIVFSCVHVRGWSVTRRSWDAVSFAAPAVLMKKRWRAASAGFDGSSATRHRTVPLPLIYVM